ncbi:MAG TPA: methylmalonyl-CoA mutase family protein [Planococcus sp. (in: firmicutes)]|nr:methylmalonyl-CoA mutase family protein [Planococcus sp. (in: firmicutes)]
MTIESMKNITFPTRTYEDWEQGAKTALKGKSIDSLNTSTFEGVTLQALYTKDMLAKIQSTVTLQAAAVQSSKDQPGWRVAQEVAVDSAAQFLSTVREDLSRGNETIVYTSATELSWTDAELQELAELIVDYPIYFKLTAEDQDILRVFEMVPAQLLDRVRGAIQIDESIDAPKNVRKTLIDTIPVHQAGGSAVHELGVALSILAEKIEAGAESSDLWVRFAVDTQFFQEIAKLRAFRVLWKAFASAYGESWPAVPLYTETSVRSYSKLDPYVNLLRGGNATFSAVLGGTDTHTVHPHDFLTQPTASSRRIARNVQLVIKEEAHVSHVVDPAAGSYFVETLTKEYVDAAWEYFLAIEEAGGYSQVKKTGWLADDIQAKWKEREKKIATRQASLIGTNTYANPQEAVKDGKIDDSHLEYMTAKRLAGPFERLRAESKESILKTAIIHLGPLKKLKAKSDFIYGFLAVGGIEPLLSPELPSAGEINRYLEENQLDYAVLCGTDEDLETVIPALQSKAVIDVAGRYPEEKMKQWSENGIRDSIHSGKHLTNKLQQILTIGKEAL